MKKKYHVIKEKGVNCPRCKKETETRVHKSITSKQLRQPYYYSQWYYCFNRECPTKQIMIGKYMVVKYKKSDMDELKRQESFIKSI